MSERNNIKSRKSLATHDSDSEVEDESSNVSEDVCAQGEDASSVNLACAGKDDEATESEMK